MRFYLFSENKGSGIRIANAINNSGNTCILSDADSSDYRSIIKDIRGTSQEYDFSILISRDPVSAAIEANRIGVRAFACKDPEEAEQAARANVNLIVLDEARLDRMNIEAIIDSFSSKSEKPRRPELQRKMGGFVGSIKDTFAPEAKPVQKEAKQRQKEDNEEDREEGNYEEQTRRKGKGGGFFGSLKETFGVD